MTITDLYPLAIETMEALALHYRAVMDQANVEVGLKDHDWGMLFAALGVEPEPLTMARLQWLVPYAAAEALDRRLAATASRGFLAPDRDGAYRLTEVGRQAAWASILAAHAQLSALDPLPADELRRLLELLRRLVDAALAAPEPVEKHYLHRSRLVDPGADAAPAVRIDQYLTDLALFRDDAHLASWRPYEISGQAWEALTLIWRGEAGTLDVLVEQLARREQTRAAYAAALHTLADRGWVAERDGTYDLTEQGRVLRQHAEDETDRLFYQPWQILDDGAAQELRMLLTRLRDRARELSADSIDSAQQ
jgi:DNA-binding MarR family transcriptional regulator